MKRIIADNELLARLQVDESGVEISDSAGNVIGYFVRPEIYWRGTAAWERLAESEVARLERIAREKDVCTLDEIWTELGAK